MTRKSRRELERAVDDLGGGDVPNVSLATLLSEMMADDEDAGATIVDARRRYIRNAVGDVRHVPAVYWDFFEQKSGAADG